MRRQVFISGINYELGDLFMIEDLPELRGKADLLHKFQEFGLRSYSRSELSPAVLATKTASKTLTETSVSGRNIDAVIYGTTSFSRTRYYREDVADLMSDLGIEGAYVFGVSLSECVNMITGLRVAINLIRSEECRNILLITADRVEDGEARVVPPGVSVFSDAASSCLVSCEKGDFSVLELFQHFDCTMWSKIAASEMSTYFLGMSKGIRHTCESLLKASNKSVADFVHLFANNYNLSVLNSLSFQTGFEVAKIFTHNIGRIAHAYAADPFINLCDYLHEDHQYGLNSLFLLLATGPAMWGGCVIASTKSKTGSRDRVPFSARSPYRRSQ